MASSLSLSLRIPPNYDRPELLTGEFNFVLQAGAGLKNDLYDGREEEPAAEKREAVAHEANVASCGTNYNIGRQHARKSTRMRT
jgi:hypothetical protein